MADYVLNKVWFRDNGVLKEVDHVNGKELHAIHYNGNNYIKAPPTPPVPPPLTFDGILASIAAGTYATDYHVGDLIPLDLGTEGAVDMQIVGFNVDELSDGTGNSHISFISKQLLNTKHRMTDTNTHTGGWGQSGMRTYLIDTIKPLIPETVRNAIKEVKKYSYSIDPANSDLESNDTVWIPSAREVGSTLDSETRGPVYSGVFTDTNSRIKYKVGPTAKTKWWMRSAEGSAASYFWVVSTDGSLYGAGASYSYGVALGFCL